MSAIHNVVTSVLPYRAVSPNMPLVETALRGKLAIPDFADFVAKIDDIYEECRSIKDGEVSLAFGKVAQKGLTRA